MSMVVRARSRRRPCLERPPLVTPWYVRRAVYFDADGERHEIAMPSFAQRAPEDADAAERRARVAGQVALLKEAEKARDEAEAHVAQAPQIDADAIRRELANMRELRWLIYKRDGYRCTKCGSEVDLTLDHIVPVSKGGTNVWWNLTTLCRPCNSSKGAR